MVDMAQVKPGKRQLAWYWYRLRAMSGRELLARIEHAVRKRWWRRRNSWEAPEPNIVFSDKWVLQHPRKDAYNERVLLLDEAADYLEGHYNLLHVPLQTTTLDWHLDPETGTRAPLAFGLDIDYRDRALVGNIKNVWEYSRHRHLTVVALAYALTRDERYAREVEKQLLSWLKDNPFPLGVHWHSTLELGVRLIAWVWIERLLRGSDSHAKLFGASRELWAAVYWHQWMIHNQRSYGSSANNHLVGEMAGLYIASAVWPYFAESPKWQATAREVLEQEVSVQTFSSGLNREQAFFYHRFSLELFLLAGLEAERAEAAFSPNYRVWVKRMLEVIPVLLDVAGNPPRYGDEDGGTALQLRPRETSPLDWLYRLGIFWVRARIPLPKSGSGLLAATVIWPDGRNRDAQADPPMSGSVSLQDAGLFILTSNRGTPREVFCLADAGSLGFLSTAAHGHADALSFTLNVGGHPVIIDPGTYGYFCGPEWRDYFRGTKAHNTMLVDGQDQSRSGGAFLWVRKADARVLHWRPGLNGAELLAEHDGYTRLPGRVVHRRRLTLTDKRLDIHDELAGHGEHELQWRLHFHPSCRCDLQQDRCRVSWRGGSLQIDLAPVLEWRLAQGEPDAGWYSPAFNLKMPTTTLMGVALARLPQTVTNYIKVADREDTGDSR